MANSNRRQPRSSGRYAESKQAGQNGRHNRSSTIAMVCVAATILLVALLIGLGFFLKSPSKTAQVPANVSAAGVDLGGMTQDEAENALRSATQDTFSKQNMVIQVLDATYALTPVDTGAALDVHALAKAAVQLPEGQVQVMDILPYLTLDRSAIESVVETLGQQYNSELTQGSYTIETDAEGQQVLVLTLGTPRCQLDTQQLYQQILDAYNTNRFLVEAACTAEPPEAMDLDAIYEACYQAPVDAVMDMNTFTVTPEVNGQDFDLEAAKETLAIAHYGDVIEIPIVPIVPEVTSESLQSLLFRDTLASFSTPLTSDEDRNTNLRLASQACNGLVLQPGEVFSFNQALGQRTEEKGYRPGPSYAGGKTVYTVGGGICQVASTIYYCALMSDLEIVDRDYHMFYPGYVPYGMDATINWGTIDFQFRNNTDYPLRIEAEVSGGNVNVRLIGTDNKDTYVKMEYEILETYPSQTIYQEMAPDNAEGYKDGDVITTGYTGYRVYTYRCRYDKETDKLISRNFEAYSDYSSRDEVICKIVGSSPTEETNPPIIGGGGVSEDPGD